MKPAQTLKHKNSITPKQFQGEVVPQGEHDEIQLYFKRI